MLREVGGKTKEGALGVEGEWTEVISVEHFGEIEAGPSNS